MSTSSAKASSSVWWWFKINCSSKKEAKQWEPDQNPKIKYAIYVPHRAPSGKRHYHVHCLINYVNSVRFNTLQNKLYTGIKYARTQIQRENYRNYCFNPMKPDGSLKGKLAEPKEIGTWKEVDIKGKRNDLDEAKAIIQSKTKWSDVVNDNEITSVVARHMKWSRSVYDNRPIDFPEIDMSIGIQDWQKEVIEVLKESPKKRRIIWIWSREHETGKTTFKDYLMKEGYSVLDGVLDLRDLLYAYDGHKIIWFDFAKTSFDVNEKFIRHRNNVLEKISNGTSHLSTKYEVLTKLVFCHVIVSSNDPPPDEELPNRIVSFYATLNKN